MRTRFVFTVAGLFLIASMVVSGCDLLQTDPDEVSEDIVQTSVVLTLTAYADTIADDPGQDQAPVNEVTPTETMTRTITLTPTETQTPTPSVPRALVDVDTNCRTGPGSPYVIRGYLLVGEEAEVLGRYDEGDYWVIKNPDRPGECWIWGFYATLEGPIDDLPVYTQPPTPTPVVDWSGTWTTSHGPGGMMHETYIVTLNQTNANVTGSFMLGAATITLSGSLSADRTILSGTWDDGTNTGPFTWKLINVNQFAGNRNTGTYEWCGFRSGAGLPSPCQYP